MHHVADHIEASTAAETIIARARLFDTPQQAVIGTTHEGTIVYWNAAAHELYGRAAEEAVGRDILDVTPSDMSRDSAAELMERLRNGRSWTGSFQVQGRDRVPFTVFVRDLPILDDEGHLLGIVGISSPDPAEHP